MIALDRLLEIAAEALVGVSTAKAPIRARWVVAFALRERGLSYPEIARIVGRDHSTVQSGLRNARALTGAEGRLFLAAVRTVAASLDDLPQPSSPTHELHLTVEEARAVAADETVVRDAFPTRPVYELRVAQELAGLVEVVASQGRPPAVAWRLAPLDPRALARALDRR